MAMDNYPDGLDKNSTDPRSPFYSEPPECDECGCPLDVDVDCDEEGYYEILTCRNDECEECE